VGAPPSGNPFDVPLTGRFAHGNCAVDVDGFYDRDGLFRMRFMPDEIGEWRYETSSVAT
jgi:hypothetical protein